MYDYSVHSNNQYVSFYGPAGALRLTRTFVCHGNINGFKKALKFVAWLFSGRVDMLDEALTLLENVIELDGCYSSIMDKHIEAINNMRRKYGVQ